jgi:hypothetical protein
MCHHARRRIGYIAHIAALDILAFAIANIRNALFDVLCDSHPRTNTNHHQDAQLQDPTKILIAKEVRAHTTSRHSK